jgi:formamidopyrimidine-DNA glycosylase
VRDLRPHVQGRRFTAVQVGVPRMVHAPSPAQFARALPGRTVRSLTRHGKFITFGLDHGALVAHLMMGGGILYKRPSDAPTAYTRLTFGLDGGAELRFVNPRTLGGVWLVDDPAVVIGHLGPDALGPAFTAAYFAERLAGRSAPLKPLLLDQGLVAGVGNIYCDEALWLAGLRPEREAGGLSAAEVARLHAAVLEALEKGVRLRGTSFDTYVNPGGDPGAHQDQTNVFRREGKPCLRCGAIVQKKSFRGRGTHYCPNAACQA